MNYYFYSGFGTGMVNSEMVVTWPNDDGSATLSQRKATQHAMPRVNPAPSRIAKLAVDDVKVDELLYLQ
jgi:hypothetical protein